MLPTSLLTRNIYNQIVNTEVKVESASESRGVPRVPIWLYLLPPPGPLLALALLDTLLRPAAETGVRLYLSSVLCGGVLPPDPTLRQVIEALSGVAAAVVVPRREDGVCV